MSEFHEELPGVGGESQLQGLLFTGDVFRSLTSAHLEAIGQIAISFDVEMQLVLNTEQSLGAAALADSEQGETEPNPVPATKEDFRQFATEHGYSDSRACRSWNSLGYTTPHDTSRRPADLLPPVRWIKRSRSLGAEIIDVGSIRERLVASGLRSDAWVRGSSDHVRFLAQLVNELIQTEEPLPTSRAEWLRHGQSHL